MWSSWSLGFFGRMWGWDLFQLHPWAHTGGCQLPWGWERLQSCWHLQGRSISSYCVEIAWKIKGIFFSALNVSEGLKTVGHLENVWHSTNRSIPSGSRGQLVGLAEITAGVLWHEAAPVTHATHAPWAQPLWLGFAVSCLCRGAQLPAANLGEFDLIQITPHAVCAW